MEFLDLNRGQINGLTKQQHRLHVYHTPGTVYVARMFEVGGTGAAWQMGGV